MKGSRPVRRGIVAKGPVTRNLGGDPPYHATQFGAACASLGVTKIHTPAYDAPAKGKIERFFSTMRTQLLPEIEAARITTLDALNASFWAWLDQMYHVRLHSETGQTPFGRFTASPGFEAICIPDPEALRQAFLWRAKRRVSSMSTVELQGNTYHVDLGRFLRGDTIELRFDPFDLARIDIYQHGKFLVPVTLVHQKRAHHMLVDKLVPERLRKHADAHTGADFLARLRAEHDAALRKQIGTIRFSDLDSDIDSDLVPQGV